MHQRSILRDFDSLTAATKTLRVLEMVAAAGEKAVSDLTTETGLPKSTLLRILGTLVDEGFLTRVAHGRYAPSLKLWRLGCNAVELEDVRASVGPSLTELMTRTGETALYAVYEDGRAVYVEKVEGTHPVRAYTSLGSSSPAYASATGKVLLAHQPDAEIERVLAEATPFTGATVTDVERFRGEAAQIRKLGYAVNRGEWNPDVAGVAAPIFDLQRTVAAIGVSGPVQRVLSRQEDYAALVTGVAAELSARFGHLGTGPA